MSESQRRSIESLVIVPASSKTSSSIVGDFKTRKDVAATTFKGAYYGHEVGITLCVFLLLCLVEPYLIPIAIGAGAVTGYSKAAIQNRIQEFYDRLARSIEKSALPPFSNDQLAASVYTQIRKLDYTNTIVIEESAALPEDSDTILLVSLDGLELATDGRYAEFKATARAAIRNIATRDTIWSAQYHYKDRETLENWTENDSEAVARFLIYAKHHISQQIAHDSLLLVQLRHVLRPVASDTVIIAGLIDWQGRALSERPALAWDLVLLGDDPYGSWSKSLDEDDITFELHVFDGHDLVYQAERIAEPMHQVRTALGECRSLRWSVRPHYHFEGQTRVGPWMRYHADPGTDAADTGSNASVVPGYLAGFAVLETPCNQQ